MHTVTHTHTYTHSLNDFLPIWAESADLKSQRLTKSPILGMRSPLSSTGLSEIPPNYRLLLFPLVAPTIDALLLKISYALVIYFISRT